MLPLKKYDTQIIRQLALEFPCVQCVINGINYIVIYVMTNDSQYYTILHQIKPKEKKYFPENKYPMIDYDNEAQI